MFKNKKIKTVVIVAIIVILSFAIVSFANYMARITLTAANASPSATGALQDERQGIVGDYAGKTRDEILEDLQKNQQIVTDNVSSNVTFESGKTGAVGSWVMENIETNNVIQQATIYFGDQKQEIATTEPVYPGQYIQSVELQSDFDPGEYEALVSLNYYNVSDKSFAGQVAYKIHMTVQ